MDPTTDSILSLRQALTKVRREIASIERNLPNGPRARLLRKALVELHNAEFHTSEAVVANT